MAIKLPMKTLQQLQLQLMAYVLTLTGMHTHLMPAIYFYLMLPTSHAHVRHKLAISDQEHMMQTYRT